MAYLHVDDQTELDGSFELEPTNKHASDFLELTNWKGLI